MMFKTKREKDNDYEKRLYDSSIIQEMYNTINMLEARIKLLEDKLTVLDA